MVLQTAPCASAALPGLGSSQLTGWSTSNGVTVRHAPEGRPGGSDNGLSAVRSPAPCQAASGQTLQPRRNKGLFFFLFRMSRPRMSPYPFFQGPRKKKFYDDLVIHTHDATWPCIAPRIPTSNIPSLAYLWVTPLGIAFCFSPFAIRYISSEAKKGRTTLTVLGTTPLGDQGCPNGPHSLQLDMCPRSYPRQLDRHTLPDISCSTLWPRRRIDHRQLHTSRCPAPRTCTRAPT